MVARQETQPGAGSPTPDVFRAAVATMHAATLRPEIFCEEMPAPQRIAPYAAALSADVTVEETDVGTGRLILLHDPAGNEAWAGGTFRCVLYTRAEVEVDMINDQMMGEVGWSWLTEALEQSGAGFTALGGTVTQTSSARFGDIAGPARTDDLELRASWTALDGELAEHGTAFYELMATAVGLPPVGVTLFGQRS